MLFRSLATLANPFQIWQQMGPLGPFVAKFGTWRPKGRASVASAAPLRGIWSQFPFCCVLAVLILPTYSYFGSILSYFDPILHHFEPILSLLTLF